MSTSRHAPGRAGKPGQEARTLDALLDTSTWYAGLSQSVRLDVRAQIREIDVPAGHALVRRGDTPRYWYGTIDGLLKWSVSRDDGRSVTLGGLSTGSWFGEGTLLHGAAHTADIIALKPSRVALLPADSFAWLRSREPPFGEFLLRQINERMQWFLGTFTAQHLLDTDGNVARALAGLFHPWLHPLSNPRLWVSQEEIANLSGLSRQRCNAALRRLADAGLIQIEYPGITVMDIEGLRTRAALR